MYFSRLLKSSLAFVALSSFSQALYADYESISGYIDHIYLIDNGSDTYGYRIKLTGSSPTCSEWYIKMNSPLRDQMFSLALSSEAQNKEITLMRRNESENLPGTTVCGIHRIYSKNIDA